MVLATTRSAPSHAPQGGHLPVLYHTKGKIITGLTEDRIVTSATEPISSALSSKHPKAKAKKPVSQNQHGHSGIW